MKILNLYAGIGGNRKLWGEDYEVTAVENNPEIAKVYQQFFPKDKVIVADAHQFLLEHYNEYDFIWSSPPCQTHSRVRKNLAWKGDFLQNKPKFPDMKLYEEIIFLKHFAKCFWIVENVRPYYEPLIQPNTKIDRHLFWCNFKIIEKAFEKSRGHNDITGKTIFYGFDLTNIKMKHRKDQIIRNLVNPELALHILSCALSSKKGTKGDDGK